MLGLPRVQALQLLVVVITAAALSWNPRYPEDQALQHVPTALTVLMLVATARRCPLSNASFTLVTAFLLLHALAARWVYTFVPYDDWTERLLGFRLGARLGWRRNHFDRLVHFAFGLLLFVPFREAYGRLARPARGFASWFALELILAASVLYELCEWGAAMVFAPATADRYLGQQGDAWDAHKDVALGLAGGLAAWLLASALAGLRRLRSRAGHADAGAR